MKKGIYYTVLAVVLTAAVFVLPIVNHGYTPETDDDGVGKSSHTITDDNKNDTSSPEVSIPKSDETVTFLVRISGGDLIDAMNATGKSYESIRAFLSSTDSREAIDTIKKNQAVVKASIRRIVNGVDFDNCYTYNTVFNGFSLRAPYSLLPKLLKITDVESVTLVSEKNMHALDNEEEETSLSDGEDVVSAQEETESSDAGEPEQDENNEKPEKDGSDDKTYIDDKGNILLSDALSARRNDIAETDNAGSSSSTVIAVIDTAFSADNEALSYYPEADNSDSDHSALSSKAALCGEDGRTAGGKVIFAYDYAGRDTDTSSPSSPHGTQVASLIAGQSSSEPEGQFGVAAKSRLILMKVCRDGENTAPDDVLLAALDDAAKLSPDIINISMGASGLNNNDDIFTPVYRKLAASGIMLTAAAGNDGTLSRGETMAATLTDYGTVSYPSSLSCVMSSGSSDSSMMATKYLSFGSYEARYTDQAEGRSFDSFEGGDYTYIEDISSLGQETADLSGRVLIAGVSGDEALTFAQTAADIGAAGIITIGETIELPEGYELFTAAVGDITDILEKQPVGRLSCKGMRLEKNERCGLPSEFTSYGASPDLTLKPDILSPGTDIVSASDGGYSFISGTSASSALTAGAAAVMLDSLPRSVPSKNRNNIARAMLMNNAQLIKSGSLYLSPRLQGAGVLNISKAVSADSCLMYGDSASVSLGDSADGSYSFNLTIHNFSSGEKSYTLSSKLTTDRIYRKAGVYYNSLEPEVLPAEVTFTAGGRQTRSVTVPAGGSEQFTVSISLTEAALQKYREQAENGFYIDGYILASSLHIPLCGFCGDLTDADLFDSTVYDGEIPAIGKGSLVATAANGSAYPAYTLGQNMTTGIYSRNRICIGRDTVKNYTEDSAAGVSFLMPNMYLLRNTDDFTIGISDKNGAELYSADLGKASPYTDANGEPYLWLLSGFNSDGLKNLFSDLDEGSYHIRLSARPIAAKQSTAAIGYDFTVDNTPPSGLTSKTYIKEDRIYLDLHAADLNGIQGFLLCTATASGKKYSYADRLDKLQSQGYISEDCCKLVNVSADETTAQYTYDITDLYRQLMRLSGYTSSNAPLHAVSNMIVFRAVDYAYNISAPSTARTLPEHNIEVRIKDTEKRPVKGAVISNGKETAESDKNGVAVFKDPDPGMYAVTVVSLPEGCETDFTLAVVNVTETSANERINISVKRDPDYNEESDEESSEPEGNSDNTERPEKSKPVPLTPLFAVGFVGALVIISSVTLIITRKRS